jgi:hypothetical protein
MPEGKRFKGENGTKAQKLKAFKKNRSHPVHRGNMSPGGRQGHFGRTMRDSMTAWKTYRVFTNLFTGAGKNRNPGAAHSPLHPLHRVTVDTLALRGVGQLRKRPNHIVALWIRHATKTGWRYSPENRTTLQSPERGRELGEAGESSLN